MKMNFAGIRQRVERLATALDGWVDVGQLVAILQDGRRRGLEQETLSGAAREQELAEAQARGRELRASLRRNGVW